MYEEAAANLDKAIKKQLGENYTTEDLLRFQMHEGLVTIKTVPDYNLKHEFIKIKENQSDLPEKEQKSNRQINSDLAANNNCSLDRMYLITRGL